MQTRKFDELISYFNRKVADMDIDQKCKIELFGMITAIGFAHEKELNNPTSENVYMMLLRAFQNREPLDNEKEGEANEQTD